MINGALQKPFKRTLYFLLALSAVGFLLSALSLYDHTVLRAGQDHSSFLCALHSGFNCEAVNLSSYSYFLGIPVASYALFFYFAFSLFCLLGLTKPALSPDAFKGIALLLSIFSILVSAYLMLVSALFIGFYCLNCVLLYLVNISLLTVSIFATRRIGTLASIRRGTSEIASSFSSIWQPGPSNKAALRLILILVFSFLVFATLPLLISQFAGKVGGTGQQAAPVAFNLRNGPHSASYYKGSPQARFELVMFSDLECPACSRVHQILTSFIEQNSLETFFVFKNYPLDQACNPAIEFEYHLHACRLAEYARCAGEQNQFWQSVEAIYRSDSRNMSEEEMTRFLDSLARQNNLNIGELGECIDSGRHMPAILSDIEEANRLNIAGTPAVWLNGRQLTNFSPEGLRAAFR